MVSASVIMFVLAGLFFNLNLFSSGISNVSAIINPNIRLFLSSALSLFLPVMSYLFSEAKGAGYSNSVSQLTMDDLSLRAGLILTWMLIVELLRKKVDEIHMQGYSGSIQRAGRVIWLGNLVFFNIRTSGRKAVFSILWILCATKLVQRIVFTEVGKRSYAHGKNARVISSYMAQMLLQHDDHQEHQLGGVGEQAIQGGDELLKRCRYIVMGEEMLVEEPTADGYKLMNNITPADGSIIVVTVGNVWELAEKDKLFTSLDKNRHLNLLCLSFSLFKMLRRRFEHPVAITDQETSSCRELILKGLVYHNNGESAAEALFQVLNDEVTFLREYYHSVVPVVFASPFFLFVNYFLVHIAVIILCLMTIVICGNGDVSYAFRSIITDNDTLHSGFANIVSCLLSTAAHSPAAFFSIVDLFITVLLFIIFLYEEIWEFFVFLLSNWFMVSMLCNYIAKPRWRESPTISGAVRVLMWLRSNRSHGNLSFKQFSVLNLRCWPLNLPLFAIPSLVVKTEVVPNNLKKSIFEYLVEHGRGTAADYYTPLTNGKTALRRNNLFHQLSWACESDSVAEVILTWHVATCLFEVKCPPQSSEEDQATPSSVVAIRLSKYCAYLVAFHPEQLPDNQEKAELVFEDMRKELKGMLGCRDYYFSLPRARVGKIMERIMRVEETTGQSEIQVEPQVQNDRNNVVVNGAKLGRLLINEANSNGQGTVWKVLADVWTELIIFVASSSEEERVKGHDDVLLQVGEFITVLWALTKHIGIARPAKTTSRHPQASSDLV
ncbi:hypothetical protein BAE44_0022963 [Dichanthelium oligosanthes]|uniref:DUF4220 domain-containing protein n=1 Tax=Dichanthelium oligosanthes TaxID=888268 RepID=A0A1E5UT75_9POAL|nr:hypothetical protein BAE44_0022963 [Dichanthelium oligosanthes]